MVVPQSVWLRRCKSREARQELESDSFPLYLGCYILSLIAPQISNSRISLCTRGCLFRLERLLCIGIYFRKDGSRNELFCISVCLIRESRIFNKMPSSQSHIYPQSFNYCAVCVSLVPETMLPLSLALLAWDLTCAGKCYLDRLSLK